MFMNERMRTMSLAENSERRLRRWVESECRDTDVAADVRILLVQIDRMRQVITAYVGEVESGERFDELVCLVPGLVSDDGVYGDVGATIRERG
jgi:hypothetical protein